MSVRFDRDGDVGVITLESPDGLNRLDDDVTGTVLAAIERAAEASALVLTARGRLFSAGGDLRMLPELADDAAAAGVQRVAARIRENAKLIEALLDFEGPTIAAVSGACVGAAVGWISACDVRIATRNAKVKAGFLSLGLSSDFGTAGLLAEALGRSRALAMLVGGVPLSAEDGVRGGFFTEVVADEDLLARAKELCREGAAAPWAVRALRRNVAEPPLRSAALEAEARRFAEVIARAEEVPAFRALRS